MTVYGFRGRGSGYVIRNASAPTTTVVSWVMPWCVVAYRWNNIPTERFVERKVMHACFLRKGKLDSLFLVIVISTKQEQISMRMHSLAYAFPIPPCLPVSIVFMHSWCHKLYFTPWIPNCFGGNTRFPFLYPETNFFCAFLYGFPEKKPQSWLLWKCLCLMTWKMNSKLHSCSAVHKKRSRSLQKSRTQRFSSFPEARAHFPRGLRLRVLALSDRVRQSATG